MSCCSVVDTATLQPTCTKQHHVDEFDCVGLHPNHDDRCVIMTGLIMHTAFFAGLHCMLQTDLHRPSPNPPEGRTPGLPPQTRGQQHPQQNRSSRPYSPGGKNAAAGQEGSACADSRNPEPTASMQASPYCRHTPSRLPANPCRQSTHAAAHVSLRQVIMVTWRRL